MKKYFKILASLCAIWYPYWIIVHGLYPDMKWHTQIALCVMIIICIELFKWGNKEL